MSSPQMEALLEQLSPAFPGNHLYTLNSLVEELALMERHLRDGSWRSCSCNPEKHLPLIAGLASEGVGFAEADDEKKFMEQLRNSARERKNRLKAGGFSDEDADELLKWGSAARHSIEDRKWKGRPLCDQSSETFGASSSENSAKGLYLGNPSRVNQREHKMATNTKEIATVYGADWLGKAVVEGEMLLDARYPGAVLGQDPSLVIDIVAAVAAPIAAMKLSSPWDYPVLLIGAYVSTDLVRHIKKYVGVPATARSRYAPAGTPRQEVPASGRVRWG